MFLFGRFRWTDNQVLGNYPRCGIFSQVLNSPYSGELLIGSEKVRRVQKWDGPPLSL